MTRQKSSSSGERQTERERRLAYGVVYLVVVVVYGADIPFVTLPGIDIQLQECQSLSNRRFGFASGTLCTEDTEG